MEWDGFEKEKKKKRRSLRRMGHKKKGKENLKFTRLTTLL